MSNKITVDPDDAPDMEAQRETFEWHLADGTPIIVGLPKGVHRLKLRDILTTELLADNEIVTIAKALLCIRSIGGKPPILSTYNEFEFLLNRFGNDTRLDEFMNEYQKLTNPEMSKLIQKALDEGMEQKLKPGQLQDLISLRVMEHEARNRDKVKS